MSATSQSVGNAFRCGDGLNPYRVLPFRGDHGSEPDDLPREWRHPDLLALAVLLSHPGLGPCADMVGEYTSEDDATDQGHGMGARNIPAPQPAPLPDPAAIGQEILDLVIAPRSK